MLIVPPSLPPVTFPTLGWQVIDWMEAMLCHGPGDVQGDDLLIDDEEALFICWAYRVYPRDHPLAGRRPVRRAIYSRPKGRRKSEIAGAVTCAEALGPVRFDGWDANGEPVGRPVTSPFIRCLATEEDQSGNTYDNVYHMLTHGRAADEYAVDVGLTRTFINEPGGGEIRPSTSGAASKDGGKESFGVADETHLYIQNELRGMYRTVSRNTGKRKIAEPWLLDTTTMFCPGENSVAEQAHKKYAELPVEEAVEKHGVLYDHREGDDPKQFWNDASLAKAIRPAYGPAADWIDFKRIIQIIRDAEDPEEEAYRYYLNKQYQGADAWLSVDVIEQALDRELASPPSGSRVALGFDGSDVDDHTVLSLADANGDLHTVGTWIPDPNSVRWREEVNEAVNWVFSEFKVVRFYFDPPWWTTEGGKWAQDHGSPPVAEFWTNNDTKMAVACGHLKTEMGRAGIKINPVPMRTEEIRGKLTGGLSLVDWHLRNTKRKKVRIKLEDKAEEAYVVRKDRPGSDKKIDSTPSLVLARRAWVDATAKGEFDEPVYSSAAWQ